MPTAAGQPQGERKRESPTSASWFQRPTGAFRRASPGVLLGQSGSTLPASAQRAAAPRAGEPERQGARARCEPESEPGEERVDEGAVGVLPGAVGHASTTRSRPHTSSAERGEWRERRGRRAAPEGRECEPDRPARRPRATSARCHRWRPPGRSRRRRAQERRPGPVAGAAGRQISHLCGTRGTRRVAGRLTAAWSAFCVVAGPSRALADAGGHSARITELRRSAGPAATSSRSARSAPSRSDGSFPWRSPPRPPGWSAPGERQAARPRRGA